MPRTQTGFLTLLRSCGAGLAVSMLCLPLPAKELVKAKDGSGVYGYAGTPKLPWCDYHVHDPNRPAPPRVDPGHGRARPRPGGCHRPL